MRFSGLLIAVLLWPSLVSADQAIAHNETFLEALTTKCVPAAHGNRLVNGEGMTPLPPESASEWLIGQPGKAWRYREEREVVVVAPASSSCFVASKFGDVEDLKVRVARWFAEKGQAFREDKIRMRPNGEYEATYSRDLGDGWRGQVMIQGRPVPSEGGLALMGTVGYVLGQ